MALQFRKVGDSMARIRLTYFFKSVRGYGWTETFFSTRGTLTAALLDAKAEGKEA